MKKHFKNNQNIYLITHARTHNSFGMSLQSVIPFHLLRKRRTRRNRNNRAPLWSRTKNTEICQNRLNNMLENWVVRKWLSYSEWRADHLGLRNQDVGVDSSRKHLTAGCFAISVLQAVDDPTRASCDTDVSARWISPREGIRNQKGVHR